MPQSVRKQEAAWIVYVQYLVFVRRSQWFRLVKPMPLCYLPCVYKILVVDDSAATRTALTSAIERLATASVIASPNAYEALKLLPREHFDLIITDINMPDINGLEFIHYVRSNPVYKSTPLFIVSTEGAERDRKKGLDLGANEYVVKPFDPDFLLDLVKKYLSQG